MFDFELYFEYKTKLNIQKNYNSEYMNTNDNEYNY